MAPVLPTFTGPTVLSTGSTSYGCRTANAGDVNADGYDDLLVSDCTLESVHVYLGSASGLAGSPAHTFTGPASSQFGYSISGDRDLNGDGYDDVLVGAPGAKGGRGCAYVYYGGASFASTPGWQFCGASTTAAMGGNVAVVGSLDHDRYPDAVVGPAYGGTGRLALFKGGAAGLPALPTSAYTLSGYTGDGESIREAGDVNADGYGDLIVGAPHYDGEAGSFRVYYGAVGPSLSGSTQFDTASFYSGWLAGMGQSVHTLGDVDGDGYDDIVLGLPEMYAGAYSIGYLAIVRGSAAGIDTSTFALYAGESGYDPITSIVGWSVSGGGDNNGDGNPDFALGSPGAWFGGSNHGALQVVFLDGATVPATVYEDVSQTWTADGAFLGSSVDSTGDYNGDGCDEVVGVAAEIPYAPGYATSWSVRVYTPGC